MHNIHLILKPWHLQNNTTFLPLLLSFNISVSSFSIGDISSLGNWGGKPNSMISLFNLSAQALIGIPVQWNANGNSTIFPCNLWYRAANWKKRNGEKLIQKTFYNWYNYNWYIKTYTYFTFGYGKCMTQMQPSIHIWIRKCYKKFFIWTLAGFDWSIYIIYFLLFPPLLNIMFNFLKKFNLKSSFSVSCSRLLKVW